MRCSNDLLSAGFSITGLSFRFRKVIDGSIQRIRSVCHKISSRISFWFFFSEKKCLSSDEMSSANDQIKFNVT